MSEPLNAAIPSGPPLPRFGIRTLFVMTTMCAVALAIMMQTSSVGLKIATGSVPAAWVGWIIFVTSAMIPRTVPVLFRIPRELGQFVGVSLMLMAIESALIGLLIFVTEMLASGKGGG